VRIEFRGFSLCLSILTFVSTKIRSGIQRFLQQRWDAWSDVIFIRYVGLLFELNVLWKEYSWSIVDLFEKVKSLKISWIYGYQRSVWRRHSCFSLCCSYWRMKLLHLWVKVFLSEMDDNFLSLRAELWRFFQDIWNKPFPFVKILLTFEVEAGSKWSVACWFLTCLTLQPWRRRWHVTLKHQLTFNGLHSIVYQKTELFTQMCYWLVLFLLCVISQICRV
jgi:hypothetical protein